MRSKPGTPNSQRGIELRGIGARASRDAIAGALAIDLPREVSSISVEMSMPKKRASRIVLRRRDQVARRCRSRSPAPGRRPAGAGRSISRSRPSR